MKLNLTLEKCAHTSGGHIAKGDKNAVINRIVIDSRSLKAGDYFLALKGARNDGHDFVPDVVSRGAGGVIVSKAVPALSPQVNCVMVPDTLQALQKIGQRHREEFSLRMMAVTGSNGKTTTKEMIAHILLKRAESVLCTRGNYNSQTGLPLMLLELGPAHTHAVLEMGASKKGHIASLCALAQPVVGVVTNIGHAHLQSFGTIQDVLQAKWELVEFVAQNKGIVALNADDPLLNEKRERLNCPVVTFGMSKKADIRAENISQSPRVIFDLMIGASRQKIRLPVPGLFNVSNALAAVAVAIWERVPMNEIVAGLEDFSPPSQRMQIQYGLDGFVFLSDAYNANPDSMKQSLDSFVQAFPLKHKLVVLGGMKELGDSAEKEHVHLGAFLSTLPLDKIFFLGQEGEWVRQGYLESKGQSSFSIFQEQDVLRQAVKKDLSSNTAVLFKASRSVKLEEIYEPLLR